MAHKVAEHGFLAALVLLHLLGTGGNDFGDDFLELVRQEPELKQFVDTTGRNRALQSFLYQFSNFGRLPTPGRPVAMFVSMVSGALPSSCRCHRQPSCCRRRCRPSCRCRQPPWCRRGQPPPHRHLRRHPRRLHTACCCRHGCLRHGRSSLATLLAARLQRPDSEDGEEGEGRDRGGMGGGRVEAGGGVGGKGRKE